MTGNLVRLLQRRGETKAERFKRRAAERYHRAEEALRLLANLADQRQYDYTDEQVDQIRAGLQNRLDCAIDALHSRDPARWVGFKSET